MKNWLVNLKRILLEDGFDGIELFGSVNAFLWGAGFLMLALHPLSYPLGTGYKLMTSVLMPEIWFIVFIIIGLCKLIGVLSDRYVIRKWVSWVASPIWVFIFLIFLQSINSFSSLILMFLTFEIMSYSIWEFFRHARKQQIRREIREDIRHLTT